MRIDNKVKNLTQAKTAVASVLKKYRVTWSDISRNNALLAWQALGGAWKGRKVPDALLWQKKIRKEWDRKIAD